MSENGTQTTPDLATIEEALDKAFYRAVLLHRQAGVPMTFCEDDKIVKVDAKDIPIPDKYANLEPFRY